MEEKMRAMMLIAFIVGVGMGLVFQKLVGVIGLSFLAQACHREAEILAVFGHGAACYVESGG